MRSFFSSLPRIAAVVAVSGLVGSAMADISEQVFVIRATNSLGSAEMVVRAADGEWSAPGEFFWHLNGEQTLRNGAGDSIATITSGDLLIHEDPEVALNFAVVAGSLDTTFTIVSALVSFPTINQVLGQASAGITITDTNNNGASISPVEGSMYTAQYNGMVPSGTTFTTLFGAPVSNPIPGDSMTFSGEFPGGNGFTPIAGAVSDISSQFTFTLSAGDIASGTSIFRVVEVPGPGSVALLGLGGLIALRRKR